MNRRALAWVSAVVLAIVAVAWWLNAQAEVVEVSPPSEPMVERAGAPAPSTPVLAPPSPPKPVFVQPAGLPDAGLAEAEIEVFESPWRKAVGVIVELAGPGGRVSRPTDIMGLARFTLPTGSWRIIAPSPGKVWTLPTEGRLPRDWYNTLQQSRSAPLEVIAPITRVRLELPMAWRVRGRVVDSQLEPAPGAEVSGPAIGVGYKQLAGANGEFTIETTEEVLQLQARRGTARSMVRATMPGDPPITLVLEEWTQLKVDVTGRAGDRVRVRVLHRDALIAHGSDDEPLLVPVGHLSVLARRNVWARVHSGKAELDTKAGIVNRVEVDLTLTPPLKGTLVDASGRPMAGLGVQIREVDPTTIAIRTDGGVQPPRAAASTRTNHLGEFTWTPQLTGSADPLYQVMVVELWRTKTDPVLVRLDDASLNIVVEPAP